MISSSRCAILYNEAIANHAAVCAQQSLFDSQFQARHWCSCSIMTGVLCLPRAGQPIKKYLLLQDWLLWQVTKSFMSCQSGAL